MRASKSEFRKATAKMVPSKGQHTNREMTVQLLFGKDKTGTPTVQMKGLHIHRVNKHSGTYTVACLDRLWEGSDGSTSGELEQAVLFGRFEQIQSMLMEMMVLLSREVQDEK